MYSAMGDVPLILQGVATTGGGSGTPPLSMTKVTGVPPVMLYGAIGLLAAYLAFGGRKSRGLF